MADNFQIFSLIHKTRRLVLVIQVNVCGVSLTVIDIQEMVKKNMTDTLPGILYLDFLSQVGFETRATNNLCNSGK